ncbi:MAG TPA: PKD domain-containing protein [Candidatus Acidoferrum sp.]|nr:PKD domain-containing protein [Candidatus Acidoferrum sp.]
MSNGRKTVFVALVTFVLALSTMSPLFLPSYATQPPVAIFTFTPNVALVGQNVTFDGSGSYSPGGVIEIYSWSFGDGTPNDSISGYTTTHSYSAVGNYTVTLTVIDNLTLQGYTTKTVPVTLYPTTSFTFKPTTPLVNTLVTFNASASRPASGSIVSYYWDFGDGNKLNVSTPTTTHTYQAVGNYSVNLTVTDNYGFTNSTGNEITVIKPPIAAFTFLPAWPIVGQTVTFDASSSTPDGGTIVNYYWTFGDGQTATGVVVTHSYANYGTFVATLNITDSEGLSNATSSQVNVRQYPTASFIYTPSLPFANQTVTFNASASTPNGGTIVSYGWDYGDGNTGTGAVSSHSYATYGTYTVTLTVTDSEQLTNALTKSIRIIVYPYANFTHTPVYPAINTPVLFNASLSNDPDGSIVSYYWNFGDGSYATQTTPLVYHTYTVANVYNISLIVTEDDGLTANATMTMPVYTTVPIHDVGIAAVTISNPVVWTGSPILANWTTITINVTAINEGQANETFDVSVYYNGSLAGKQTLSNMPPNSTQLLQFSWDCTSVPYGYYNITAVASTVVDETHTSDNTLSGGMVTVTHIGDISGPNGVPDLRVDIRDIALVARAFGTGPGVPGWNPICDIDHNGRVDIRDISLVAKAFGWSADG